MYVFFFFPILFHRSLEKKNKTNFYFILRHNPGGGHGNPLQYSCLENLMDRRVRQTTVYSITKSWTPLKQLNTEPINNVVIVASGQQRDSAIRMHLSILPQTPLPSGLPHSIKQSSLCYAAGPW